VSTAEPVVRVRSGKVSLLVLANLAVWMGFFTPIQVLLPEQLQLIVPDHKEAVLGWVTGLGALVAVIANPLAGALSDRTAGRFGRRRPWALGGGVIGALALVLLALQQEVVGIALGWIAAQVCFNAMLAALTATVPDRVPVAQRGAISGWVGIPQVLGVVLGTILVTVFVTPTLVKRLRARASTPARSRTPISSRSSTVDGRAGLVAPVRTASCML
jgi:MFS family permease